MASIFAYLYNIARGIKMTKMSDHKKDHMMKKDEMPKTHNNGNVYDHQQHKYEKYCD